MDNNNPAGNSSDNANQQPTIPPEWRIDPTRAPRWLKPAEAAEILGRSRRTIDRMCRRRQLRASNPSRGIVYVCRDSMIALLERNAR